MEHSFGSAMKALYNQEITRTQFISIFGAMLLALLGIETLIKRLQSFGGNPSPAYPESSSKAIIPSYTQKTNTAPLAAKKAQLQDYNVLIVGYDTTGAKHISSLGYPRQTTPMLDSLADSGFNFAQNIAAASWTVPSFMSLFTGLFPTEHKVVNKYVVFTPSEQIISNLDELSPGSQTLAEQFKRAGYITGGFTGDAGVSGMFGNKDGFDTYYDKTTFGSIAKSSALALDWLKSNPNKKFFMFLHGYDAHGQFKTPPDYYKTARFVPKNYKGPYTGAPKQEAHLREEQLAQPLNLSSADVAFWTGLYDSKLRDMDDRFASFWSEFKKMGLDKNTIVVMTSDHGEEFYEHHGIDHGHTLYDELIHVPLVFHVPGLKAAASPINQQTTSLDIAPTLLELTGVQASNQYQSQMRGKSLVPIMEGGSVPLQDTYFETDYREFTHKRGVRTADGWKYIKTEQTGVEELYNLYNDPGEQRNVIKENPVVAMILSQKVRNHLVAMGDNPDKVWTVGCEPVYVGECVAPSPF